MKKWMKVMICTALSFMICFLGVGYAEISNSIYITGTANYEYIYPVYITDVAYRSGSSTNNKLTASTFDGPFLNSTITLTRYRSYGQTSGSGSYIILAVTVKNATERDYAYQSTTGADDTRNLTIGVYKDSSCSTLLTSSNGIVSGKNSMGEEQSLTFFVKLSHTQTRDVSYNPLLTFNFTTEITKEETEEVGKTVSAKFFEILNNPEDYEQLNDEIDANYDGSQYWTGTFIGNVQGSQSEDTALLNELFDGNLKISINGTTVDVTCIIKRENIDENEQTGSSCRIGNTTYNGCEMTLYMTTADLSALSFDDYPTVYAMVFTKVSEDSEWVQIGEEMYEGTARVVGYMGEYTSGSFDTGTWKSSNVYHGIARGAMINTLIQKAVM